MTVWFAMSELDEKYEQLMAIERARDDQRAKSAAYLLSLVPTNMLLLEESVAETVNDLVDLAHAHRLNPEDVQSILFYHEPSLKDPGVM